MRVARLHAPQDLRIHEEEDPTAAEGQSLVRVEAVGLCGSDLHWFLEGGIGDARIVNPPIPGHEIGGIAIDGPYAGRAVAVDPAIPCFECEHCHQGWTNLCPDVKFAGHGNTDGGMAEIMSWPTSRLVPLPEGLDAEDAAMLEPLGVAIHAWDLGHAKLGDKIAIVGAGPIGLLLLQLAKRSLAAEVIVVEPLPHRREAATAMGADAVLDTEDELPSGFDVVFEVCGNPDPVEAAMRLARAGARVVLVGIPDEDVTTFPAALARRKGLTIAIVRRMPEVYERAVELASKGLVDVKSVVSHRFGLDDASEGFAFATRREGLKVLITPNR